MTTTNRRLEVITFFCASRKFLQVKFFCIISWSRPVMVIVMNMPLNTCLTQNLLCVQSVSNTLV